MKELDFSFKNTKLKTEVFLGSKRIGIIKRGENYCWAEGFGLFSDIEIMSPEKSEIEKLFLTAVKMELNGILTELKKMKVIE